MLCWYKRHLHNNIFTHWLQHWLDSNHRSLSGKSKPLWPLSPKWTIFCCTDVHCNSWKVCYATILRIKVSSHWVNNLRGPEVRNNWGWRELLPDCWQWRLLGWNYFLLLRSNNDFSSYTSRPKRLGLFTKQILVIIR